MSPAAVLAPCAWLTNVPLFPPAYSRLFPERPYSLSLAYAARLQCDARPAHPGCGSLLDRPTSTPDKEDAHRQWTGRTRCLEVAKWPRGYSGELIFHCRLLHSPPTDLNDLRRWCAASGLLRECCVSLDGALHFVMCFTAACRQCGYLRCLSEPPSYFSSSFFFRNVVGEL